MAKEEARRALEKSQQFAYQAQLARAAGLIDRDPWMAAALLDKVELCPPERRDFACSLAFYIAGCLASCRSCATASCPLI